MAYCLRSFVQIVEEVLHPNQHHKQWVLDHDKIPQVRSLWKTASFLRDFLDRFSPLIQDRIAILEDQIMVAAEKAEYNLESYITSQLISSPEDQAFTISPPNLEEAIQAFEEAKQEVIKIMDANPVQQPDDNVLLPVSTTRYPNHNNVVVGVTEDLNQLRTRLTSWEETKLDIIPIVGMGGMGKTTLAQILYDECSSTSTSHFDCFAWVTISQSYDPKLILRTLLAFVTRNEISHEQTTGDLIVTLYQTLFNRRYLIVLDDIWSSKAWDDVKSAFPQDNKGSRIILTTRESIVANCVNSNCHEMHLIDEGDSWELLRGKVFGEESCPLEFEEVGKKIARSCGGLPLALQVISGLLFSQSHKSLYFWEHVANNVSSLIARTDDQFSGIFYWSFAQLPHYLKPCFLYMAGFREDAKIPAKKIIKLWVSEGFLYPIRDKSLEEAARIHLNALVDRNLIFVRGRGKRGRAKTLGIHDLLRDLCLRKAREKKFLYFTDNLQEDVLLLGRIVSVGAFKNPPILTPIVTPIVTLLIRSFRITSYKPGTTILTDLCFKLPLLRVLDFGSEFFYKFPGVILQLVNLRYLHILAYGTPVSISVLKNLQRLIVIQISSLAMISDMPQLRHLEFDWMEEGSELPYDIHENIQSLSRIPAMEVRKLLGKLPNLRKLGMDCRDDEKFIDLTCFHNLETLRCFFLHNMTLPISLKKLKLFDCKMGQSLLDAIGTLPNLQILIIYSPYPKIDMDWEPCEGGFCELQYLEISDWHLENWLATDVHFPVLEHLVLENCQYLNEIPNDFKYIETLKVIYVDECLPSVFDSARRIHEDQCQSGDTDLQLQLGHVVLEDYSELPYENLQSRFKIPVEEVRKLLGKLPNLRKLTIDCYNDSESIDLTSFHNLETLKCFNGFTNSFKTFPVSLKKLTLECCSVGRSLFDAIGALPNLQILILKYCDDLKSLYFDATWMGWEPSEGGFCSLHYLEIYAWDLKNLLATDVHFPILEHLVLKSCRNLIEIPNDFKYIETLKVIEVDECLPSVFDSARRILEDQCQFGKPDLQVRFGRDLVQIEEEKREGEAMKRRKKRRKRAPAVADGDVIVEAIRNLFLADSGVIVEEEEEKKREW